MSRQLNAHILPDKRLTLEFEAAEEKIGARRQSLEKTIHEFYQDDLLSALFYLGGCDQQTPLSHSLAFWRDFTHIYVERLRLHPGLERLRAKLALAADREQLEALAGRAPFMQGAEYITAEFLEDYWNRLHGFFQSRVKVFKGSVEEFFHQYAPDIHLLGRIYFHLVENREQEDYPFAFMATYAQRLNARGESQHKPLKFALTEYEGDRKKMLALLSTVNTAARQSERIRGLLDSGELFYPLKWTAAEAFGFLQETGIYEEAGILCRVPDWWKRKSTSVRLNISLGGERPSQLGMDALVDFRVGLSVDGMPLSLAEAKKLLAQSEGLARLKGKWVTLDKARLKQTIASLEQARRLMQTHGLTLSAALRMLMSPRQYAGLDETAVENLEVSAGQWLQSVFEKMRQPELIGSTPPARGFNARLRPYQQTGLDWLLLLHSLGFGGCLADDMGLGKTVQVLALLHTLAKKGCVQTASLLVLPASLLANWATEIRRFAPALRFLVAHPGMEDAETLNGLDKKKLNEFELVLTSYALVPRYEWLRSHHWFYVILDEAQAIKNPNAARTRAVKSLNSKHRLVMTGTPIENRLTDLWSLFDFLNPGLLGTGNEFARFCKRMDQHADQYASLRRVIGPYILRRLKTDRRVIADLPDKVEFDSYAELSRKQIVLYREGVNTLRQALDGAEGIQRKGLVLAWLMKFKQICNHPDQYLGQDGFRAADSGKFQRLAEICETILEKREKVLIFTQFREMTAPLDRFLGTVFGRRGVVLHGGTAVRKRERLVAEFQGNDYIPSYRRPYCQPEFPLS